MSNLLNTELLSEISEVRLMPKGERIAMSVVLQWSPDDYRIGARCKVQGARCNNLKLKNIINSLCFKSLINKSRLLRPIGGGGGGGVSTPVAPLSLWTCYS